MHSKFGTKLLVSRTKLLKVSRRAPAPVPGSCLRPSGVRFCVSLVSLKLCREDVQCADPSPGEHEVGYAHYIHTYMHAYVWSMYTQMHTSMHTCNAFMRPRYHISWCLVTALCCIIARACSGAVVLSKSFLPVVGLFWGQSTDPTAMRRSLTSDGRKGALQPCRLRTRNQQDRMPAPDPSLSAISNSSARVPLEFDLLSSKWDE
jgi:hypothetical protein